MSMQAVSTSRQQLAVRPSELAVVTPRQPIGGGRGAFGSGPSDRDPYYREVRKLRDQLEERDAKIRYLMDMLSPPGLIFPARWKLTGKEATVLRALMAAALLSKEQLLVAMYDTEPEVEIKIVDVFVCKLRTKLSREGITIETMWGTGYRMTPQMKALVTAAAEATKGGEEWASPAAPVARPVSKGQKLDRRTIPVPFTGEEIRQQRLALNLSQVGLASLAGRAVLGDVSAVERNAAAIGTVIAVCRALRLERARLKLPEPTGRATP